MYENNNEVRLTEDEVKARFDKRFPENPFPWDKLKDLAGITPKSCVYDAAMMNSLLYGRYTPAVELRYPGVFFEGMPPKVSVRVFPGKNGWNIKCQNQKEVLGLDSTIEINRWTKLEPLQEPEKASALQLSLEEARLSLIKDGFYQGTIPVRTYNYQEKEYEVENMGVCINPLTNQPLTVSPKMVKAFMFKRKGEMTTKYNGAQLTKEQIDDLSNFKEVYVENMLNRDGEFYSAYVRFDINNNGPVHSDTPCQALGESVAQEVSQEQKQEQKKRTGRSMK